MKIAMLYDDDAYVELPDRSQAASSSRGLWGRHVAGKEFLDAYLTYGNWSELVALVRNSPSRQSIIDYCRRHPSSAERPRRLQIVPERDFLETFREAPPATVLYTPQPPDERYVWARQFCGGHRFAICGLTHTLCSARANRWLISLVTAPFEEYDALICTSQSVIDMLRSLFGCYTDYLRDRFGGHPRLKPRLELVPLGVNTDKFTPPTPAERARHRATIHAAEDEVVVLFVGRLSVHGKAHPFPIFAGLQQAARQTGQKIHLVLSGWATGKPLMQTFIDGARTFAPDVRLTIVDGTKPRMRYGVWRAADIFTSLSDNIQETFGLVIVEAMAAGLPVVASDWNGYRDLVVDGKTGFLVPTAMLPGATADLTARLLMGAVDYDRFIGQCNQATVVDNRSAGEAFTRLVADPALRRQMGAAGRRHAQERFSWSKVVRAYEDIWSSQDEQLRSRRAIEPSLRESPHVPAIYPPPELSFVGYPSCWLPDETPLVATHEAVDRLKSLMSLPLTNYAGGQRIVDVAILTEVIAAAQQVSNLGELRHLLQKESRDISPQMATATIAWMLKYDLLERDRPWECVVASSAPAT